MILEMLQYFLLAAGVLLVVLVFTGRISEGASQVVYAVGCVLYAATRMAQGRSDRAAFFVVLAAVSLYLWRRGGGGRGGWRRLKRWARSKLLSPAFVRLRPGLGASSA